MTECREFGEWASIVRDGMPTAEGFRLAAHLFRCDACREALAEARRVDAGLRAGPGGSTSETSPHAMHEDLVALAAAIARREFPSDAWGCEECTEILVASIGSTTANEIERHRGPATRRVRPVWFGGALAAAAAIIVAIVATGPASQPWGRAAGLRRGQVWLMPASIATDVERAASRGEIAPPRFTFSEPLPEIERNPQRAPFLPRILSPRWEAVRDPRPEFRWAGESDGRAEVFLLDGERRYLGSFESGDPGRMSYPASAAPLTPGATYYWKVNLLGGSELRASSYVGFAVLGADEAESCDRKLARAGASPFVEGVVAERCGLYTRAAAAFDEAAKQVAEPEIAARLAREIRHRQGLDEDDHRD